MTLPKTTDELIEITLELCLRNRFRTGVYLRPFMYKAAEDVGVRLHGVPDAFAIVPIPYTPYLDSSRGLHVCVSSWRRADDTMAPPRAKITGLYVNSALAKSEAVENGYDEAILLSHDGHVAEGSAENIFLVRRGVLYTPDPSQNVLEGCTRRAIMDIAREEFGLEVVERSIDRGELYAAEEVFFTGTAAGICFVTSIDRRTVGDGRIGPIAKSLGEFYERVVVGREPRYDAGLPARTRRRRSAAGAEVVTQPSTPVAQVGRFVRRARRAANGKFESAGLAPAGEPASSAKAIREIEWMNVRPRSCEGSAVVMTAITYGASSA